ncbi:MAG TPA: adenosylhomocysteinase [Candidatus Omnitrophica bacterium]|nr:adenosylhomocysteinase [Candidatus Omnitrophota bacterium]
MGKEYFIKNISLASQGKKRIEWAENAMPVLRIIREEFKKKKPLKGVKIAACLHITTETANLVLTLKTAGARIRLAASNPLSTQDDVASALVKYHNLEVFAKKGENNKEYYYALDRVMEFSPQLLIDDGADLISLAHRRNFKALGATEETTTGVIRLRALEKQSRLQFPVIAVNDAYTKYLFDNRYGTGQSTIDGILRATNVLLAAKVFVVAGYGWCGRGLALRAKGMGAKVIVTEVNPLRALEAYMDGFQVMDMKSAVKYGDIFVTVTGNKSIITKEHFLKMKEGAILANAGHFNVEIDIPGLESIAVSKRRIRPWVDEYKLKNGKRIYLLGEGRLINLVSAEGHPSQVMDMSFANQALCLLHIYKNWNKLHNKVYSVPPEIDSRVAKLKLKTLGIKIDSLTWEQERYLCDWQEGT